MSRLTFLRGLKPARFNAAVRRRGWKGLAFHALRRMGTLAERAWAGPVLIRLSPLDFVCNHRCPMCWLQHLPEGEINSLRKRDRDEGMRLKDYLRFFADIPPGLEEINVVGGGEPLAHPEAAELLLEIKRLRVRGSLVTNGTLLAAPLAQRMIEARWNCIRVSVHAGDAETYARIHGVDHFGRLRENLRTYDRLRREAGAEKQCRLDMFHVIQRDNLGGLDRLFAFAEEVGTDFIVFERIIPYDKSKWLSADELRAAGEELESCARQSRVACNLDEIRGQLRVEETCARENIPFRPARRCSVGFDQAFITSVGDVLPCCFSNEVMGNVRRVPFRKIWRSAKYADFRKRLIRGEFPGYCITNRCALPDVLHP